ncbi:MAG: RloB family protein, partial [Clostridium sp.]|uniref:RloB family protein n=1 Tax=Clostridium sp. TaxID=1506 RepID=UPI0029138B51
MGRTRLPKERAVAIKKQYLGKILIFCEGMSEKNYIDYFGEIINKNKYTDIRVEAESTNGNARNVFNFANDFLYDESNNRKYSNYNKYLFFDCDDPPNIQEVIGDMVSSSNDYSLLVSNPLFEIWLLMYFENVDNRLGKNQIYNKLGYHLSKEYKKADKGIIREIIQKGNVEDAIKNAEELHNKYINRNDSILK